jgi:hypothetical protein
MRGDRVKVPQLWRRNITVAHAMSWRSLFILITAALRLSHVHYATGLNEKSRHFGWRLFLKRKLQVLAV